MGLQNGIGNTIQVILRPRRSGKTNGVNVKQKINAIDNGLALKRAILSWLLKQIIIYRSNGDGLALKRAILSLKLVFMISRYWSKSIIRFV